MPARACRPLCPAVPRTCLPAPACVRSASWQAVLFGDHHPLEVGRAGAAGGAEGSSACTPAAKPLAPCAEAVRLSGNRVAGPGGERPSLRCVCAPQGRAAMPRAARVMYYRDIYVIGRTAYRHTHAKPSLTLDSSRFTQPIESARSDSAPRSGSAFRRRAAHRYFFFFWKGLLNPG
jgi:hypothetical protein